MSGIFREAWWPEQPRRFAAPPPPAPPGAHGAFSRTAWRLAEQLGAGVFEPAWPDQPRTFWTPPLAPCGTGRSAAFTLSFAGESAAFGGAIDLGIDGAGDDLDLDGAGDHLLVQAGLTFAGKSAAREGC